MVANARTAKNILLPAALFAGGLKKVSHVCKYRDNIILQCLFSATMASAPLMLSPRLLLSTTDTTTALMDTTDTTAKLDVIDLQNSSRYCSM